MSEQPKTSPSEIFDSPPQWQLESVEDRYSRKPTGSADQGRKDEND